LLLRVSAPEDVPPVVLQRAQRTVLRIFEQIAVRVDWVGCGLDRRDREPIVTALSVPITVAVVSRETRALDTIPPGVLGAVIRDAEAQEIGWVFFGRVEHAADSFALDAGMVLGHAIAHEVGHLLLPRGTHGPTGLMRASWRMEDLRDAVQGQLGFSQTEGALIRARLNE
jgi:hypothetical protein